MQDDQPAHLPAITASQWRQIVNSAVDTAIISLDRQGRITSWNAGATRILGWSEGRNGWGDPGSHLSARV